MQRQRQENRARQRYRDAVARFNATFTQQVRQGDHLLAHLLITELMARISQRGRVRRFACLFVNQRAERRERYAYRRIINLRQLRIFGRQEHFGIAAAQRRIVRKLAYQRRQPRRMAG